MPQKWSWPLYQSWGTIDHRLITVVFAHVGYGYSLEAAVVAIWTIEHGWLRSWSLYSFVGCGASPCDRDMGHWGSRPVISCCCCHGEDHATACAVAPWHGLLPSISCSIVGFAVEHILSSRARLCVGRWGHGLACWRCYICWHHGRVAQRLLEPFGGLPTQKCKYPKVMF